MKGSSILRKLRKQFKRRRLALNLALWFIMFAAALVWRHSHPPMKPAPISSMAAMSHNAQPGLPGVKATESYQVWLVKQYVCGEESKWLGKKGGDEVLGLLTEHPAWNAQSEAGKVTFTENVDDLSQACKQNAYFGVDGSGNLSLFNGKPERQNVLQTFFQLNIEYLESSLPKAAVAKLYQGIRIQDFAEYNSVLSTFSDYAIEAGSNAQAKNMHDQSLN